jgi:hypothetical protein
VKRKQERELRTAVRLMVKSQRTHRVSQWASGEANFRLGRSLCNAKDDSTLSESARGFFGSAHTSLYQSFNEMREALMRFEKELDSLAMILGVRR